ILTFLTERSDQFIVDIPDICDGHPFKGENANTPHQGAHVHFDNSLNTWPKGSDVPENYPPIYAPADGIISRVDYVYPVGGWHERYGIDLAFARDSNGSIYFLCYSIEPMVMEPSDGFYRDFILVSVGEEVKKGDVIAYMYMPPGKGFDIHIHFHIMKTDCGDFMAPAIFNSTLVDEFHDKWYRFESDGSVLMPACMGYKLRAHENPFGTGDVEIL
ncbi:MAG: M23 family metallopeptidase, partial [Candidatus Hodarchaeota archaeon]